MRQDSIKIPPLTSVPMPKWSLKIHRGEIEEISLGQIFKQKITGTENVESIFTGDNKTIFNAS